MLQQRTRFDLRHKVAALSAVGVTMCALPTWQVLSWQAEAMAQADAARSAIDPVAGTVAVQRGLLAHRDSAGRVLRGRLDAEPQRLWLRADVDTRLGTLHTALAAAGRENAIDEAQSLGRDWALLAERVLQRSLQATDSDAAHRLLEEQALQVVDLLAAGPMPHLDHDPSLGPLLHALLGPLPRLTAALGALQPPRARTDRAAFERALADTEALAERTLSPLGEQRPLGARGHDKALPDAVAAARGAIGSHLRLLRDPQAAPDAWAHTASVALQAQAAVADGAAGTLQRALAQRVVAIETERTHLLAALAALALLALVLAWASLRLPGPPLQPAPLQPQREQQPRRRRLADFTPTVPALPAVPDGQTGLRVELSRLFGRLRGAPRQARTEKPPESRG